jgi:hypothetical protein
MSEIGEFDFLKIAVDVRKFEIENFWRRSLFFWGFIVASYAGYAQSKTVLTSSVITHFGFLASFSWYLVNRGSKYWQENWEKKVENLERGLNLFRTKEKVESHILGAGNFSVTKITTFLSLAVSLSWLVLVAGDYCQYGFRWTLAITSGVTIAGVLVLLFACRSTDLSKMKAT